MGPQGPQGIPGPAGGPQGPPGPTGAPGAGVPTGGYANQILVKNSSTNYDTTWVSTPTPNDVLHSMYTTILSGIGYSVNPLMKGSRTGGNTLNTLMAHLFFSGPNGVTLDKFEANVVTVGAAGAVTRAGIYLPLNPTIPWSWSVGSPWATLVKDLGTVPTDGSTGAKYWTLSPVVKIAPMTWFAIAGVDQVALAARTLGNYGGTYWTPWGLTGLPAYNAQPGLSIGQSNVLGALPSSFAPTGIVSTDCGIAIHRSA